MISKKDVPNVDLIPFRLNNIEDFIQRSHPKINPIEREKEYIEYWDSFTEKIIKGCWGRDYDKKKDIGGWRFMPNHLFHYTNAFWIELRKKGKPSVTDYPDLRDWDWFVGYGVAEMDGFCGFEYDDKITCFKGVQMIEQNIELDENSKLFMDMYADHLYDKNGKLKKYMGAKEYLYQTFKEPLGDPLYFGETMNMLTITGRRQGKSYHAISKGQRGFITNGARTLEEYILGETSFNTVFGSFDQIQTKENWRKWEHSYTRLKNLGDYRDDYYNENGYYYDVYSGTLEDVNSFITNSFRVKGEKSKAGVGSITGRVSYDGGMRNWSKAVGFAPNYIVNEEYGTWPNPDGVNSKNEPALKRDYYFGSMWSIGTGGEMKYSKNIRTEFFNPKSMRYVEYPNLYQKNGKPTGMFTPTQYSMNQFRNEMGNLDRERAWKQAFIERERKYQAGGQKYIKHISENPMCYNDVFMQGAEGNLPIKEASEHLTILEGIPWREREFYGRKPMCGTLSWDGDKKSQVFFKADPSANPIMNHDDLESNTEDKYSHVIYEPPMPGSRYITFYDGVLSDSGTSYTYTHTFKWFGPDGNFNFNLVAELVSRLPKQRANDLEAIKQALFYRDSGSIVSFQPEYNTPSVFVLCEDLGLFYDLLQDCPQKAMSTIIPNYRCKGEKGVRKEPHSIDKINKITGEFLSVPVGTKLIDEVPHNVLLVETIPSEFMLNDIIYYRKDGNFDAFSALQNNAVQWRQFELTGGFYDKKDEKMSKFEEKLRKFALGGIR